MSPTCDLDLIVAGGGPVGLAAAIEARRRGLTVVVVEPRAGPVDKACGEGLMPTTCSRVRDLGAELSGRPFVGIRYLRDGLSVDARFRAGPGLGVRRTVLHEALARRADSVGVERVQGTVTDVVQDSGNVLAAGRQARWLVAADGLHSSVRRGLGLDVRVPGPARFGLRRHFAAAPWTDHVEVHWSTHAEAYVTPVAEDLVGVAVLGPPGTGFDEALDDLPALRARLRGAAPASDLRGAGPLRQRRPRGALRAGPAGRGRRRLRRRPDWRGPRDRPRDGPVRRGGRLGGPPRGLPRYLGPRDPSLPGADRGAARGGRPPAVPDGPGPARSPGATRLPAGRPPAGVAGSRRNGEDGSSDPWDRWVVQCGLEASGARQTASAGTAAGRSRRPGLVREIMLIAGLFLVYRLARLAITGHDDLAMDNAWWVWGVERTLGLPDEEILQEWALQWPDLLRAANWYYVAVHFPITAAFLAWGWWRRPPAEYRWARRLITTLTALALVVHVLMPLAPPRMLRGLGFLDTMAVFGPSAYDGEAANLANQFAAMPSLHVGWALLIAFVVIRTTVTRWRWVAVIHPLITVVVVVATANHYWVDAIAAALLLGLAVAVTRRPRRSRPGHAAPADATAPAAR